MIEAGDNRPPLLMVGFAIPEGLMSSWTGKDMYPQAQGHQHQWSLIRGIESVTGYPMDLVSVAALGDWPRHPARFVRGGIWSHAPGARDVMVSFINISPLKQITRFVAVCCHIGRWLLRHRRSPQRVIFLYTSQSSQLWALLLTTAFVPALKIAVLADPPSVDVVGESRVRRLARRVDRWLQRRGLQKMDGVIALTKTLADDFATSVPYCVSEGVAPNTPLLPKGNANKGKLVALYAGGLTAQSGVRLLLDAVPLLSLDMEVWLFGRGELEREATELAAHDGRLKYFGFTPREFLLEHVAKASLLLMTRPSDIWLAHRAFPSKILEYMATGIPMLATRLPVIPPDYEPYVFWLDEESPEGLAHRLVELRELGAEVLREKGSQAREFVREHKSEAAQGRHIWHFVSQLLKNQP